MDKLDKIAVVAIAALLAWALVLIVYTSGTGHKNKITGRQRQLNARQYLDPNLAKKIKQVKNLLAAGSLEKAGLLADEMIKKYPFEGMPYMLKGDFRLHKQDPIGAMLNYKEAVDLNPDFLDKNTKVFQGIKIKQTVAEAQAMIEKALADGSDDAKLQKNKKVLYYMLRKIAGGCE